MLKRIGICIAVLVSVLGCSKNNESAKVPATVLEPAVSVMEVYNDTPSATIDFKCDGSWTCSATEDWLKIATPSGTGSAGNAEQSAIIEPAVNETGEDRCCIVEFQAGKLYGSVFLTQLASGTISLSRFLDTLAIDNKSAYTRCAVCAHRANTYDGIYVKGDCPENSLPAIQRCIDLGIDMIELDVCKTKDGVIILSHDTYISNVTTGSGNIADMNYSDICKYDMKIRQTGTIVKGVRMARLSDALTLCKDKIFVNLDLTKMDISMSEIVDIIRQCGMLDQVCCYTGSDTDAARSYYKISNRLVMHVSITTGGGATTLNGAATTPLFQISTKYYFDGTSASTSLSKAIHNTGHCCFSNILDYDSGVRQGTATGRAAVSAFLGAKLDFLQTDYADFEYYRNAFAEAGVEYLSK